MISYKFLAYLKNNSQLCNELCIFMTIVLHGLVTDKILNICDYMHFFHLYDLHY